jgi:hypothetical protein
VVEGGATAPSRTQAQAGMTEMKPVRAPTVGLPAQRARFSNSPERAGEGAWRCRQPWRDSGYLFTSAGAVTVIFCSAHRAGCAVRHIEPVDRGYSRSVKDLRPLGVDIARATGEPGR